MKRGDIWWAHVPDAGRRPVLVLTRDEAIPGLQNLVCVPLTRTIRSTPAEMSFDEDDGMPSACVANFDDIRPVRKSRFATKITEVAAERRHELCDTLDIALGC